VDLTRLDAVLDRTDGVTASFLKELLRRTAVVAADRVATSEEDRLHVTPTPWMPRSTTCSTRATR
jgi:hypothetical protein